MLDQRRFTDVATGAAMDSTSGTRDLTRGVPETELEEGRPLRGQVGEDAVLLVRTNGNLFAVGDRCTHYGGSLSQGLVVGDTVRCPLHHACFSLRTGQPTGPAFQATPCWKVERSDGSVFVRERLPQPDTSTNAIVANPSSVVIVGGGCAGFAAAGMLRREGYTNPITMISADTSAPYDRPNASKDYLSGEASNDWMPLESEEFYRDRQIQLELGASVQSIDIAGRRVALKDGRTLPFGALLLSTGANPIHLPLPGADGPHVHYLRTMADADSIIREASSGKHAIVIGASFIGLETAASLRTRGVDVDIVAPEALPLERILGAELGRFVGTLHEEHGVRFHLGQSVVRIDGQNVTLTDGQTLSGDFIVIGVGVAPATSLAADAGLAVNRGVVVNEYLETSAPGVFAAGDIARYPEPVSGDSARIEHWVVAARQGQVAARNILGQRQPFDVVPFFWTRQYGVMIRYVGHAERWDRLEIDGNPESDGKRGCRVDFIRDGRRIAAATVGRAHESLAAEAALEADVKRLRGQRENATMQKRT
jgi:apoptosis-inducing factor 3